MLKKRHSQSAAAKKTSFPIRLLPPMTTGCPTFPYSLVCGL